MINASKKSTARNLNNTAISVDPMLENSLVFIVNCLKVNICYRIFWSNGLKWVFLGYPILHFRKSLSGASFLKNGATVPQISVNIDNQYLNIENSK